MHVSELCNFIRFVGTWSISLSTVSCYTPRLVRNASARIYFNVKAMYYSLKSKKSNFLHWYFIILFLFLCLHVRHQSVIDIDKFSFNFFPSRLQFDKQDFIYTSISIYRAHSHSKIFPLLRYCHWIYWISDCVTTASPNTISCNNASWHCACAYSHSFEWRVTVKPLVLQ